MLEISVVARPHPLWGERPMAFVTLHPQYAHLWEGRHREFETELKTHGRERLPGFACPEWITIVPELPVHDILFLFTLLTYFDAENINRQDTQNRIAQGYCQVVDHNHNQRAFDHIDLRSINNDW